MQYARSKLLLVLPPHTHILIHSQIRMHRKREHLLQTMHSKTEPYPFDYFFEQTTRSGGSGTEQHESSSSSDSDS